MDVEVTLPPRPPPGLVPKSSSSSSSSSSSPSSPSSSSGMKPLPLTDSKKVMQGVLVRHCLTPVARTPLRKTTSYLIRAALDLGVCSGPASAAPADLPSPVIWSNSAEFSHWLRAMVQRARMTDGVFRRSGLVILPEQKAPPQDAAKGPLLPTPPQPAKRPLEAQNHDEQAAKKAAPPQPAKKAVAVANAPQQHQAGVKQATPAARSTQPEPGVSHSVSPEEQAAINRAKRKVAIGQLLRDAVQKLTVRDTQAVDRLLKEAMTLLAAQNALDKGKELVLQRALEKISSRLQELKKDQTDLKAKQAVKQHLVQHRSGTAGTSTPPDSKGAAKSGASVSFRVPDVTARSTSTTSTQASSTPTSCQTSASSTPLRPRKSTSTQTSACTPRPLPVTSISTQTSPVTPPAPVTSTSTQTSPVTPPAPVTSTSTQTSPATPPAPVTSTSTQTSSPAPPASVPVTSSSTQTSPSSSPLPLTGVSTQPLSSISTDPGEAELPLSVCELVIRAVNFARAITEDIQSEAQLQEVLASAKRCAAN